MFKKTKILELCRRKVSHVEMKDKLKLKMAEGMAQVVECLSSKWEALSSNLSTTNNKTGIRYTKAH
jgi:hypothetical protein